MAQTEFTGKLMSFTYATKKLTGLLKVSVPEDDAPPAEPIDVTTDTDSAYTTIPDPLGAKGSKKCKVTVTVQDSTASYADLTNTKFAFNTPATGIFDMAVGVATANTWTHTALELTERTTEIPWDAYATCVLVFEANSVGAWTGPA